MCIHNPQRVDYPILGYQWFTKTSEGLKTPFCNFAVQHEWEADGVVKDDYYNMAHGIRDLKNAIRFIQYPFWSIKCPYEMSSVQLELWHVLFYGDVFVGQNLALVDRLLNSERFQVCSTKTKLVKPTEYIGIYGRENINEVLYYDDLNGWVINP